MEVYLQSNSRGHIFNLMSQTRSRICPVKTWSSSQILVKKKKTLAYTLGAAVSVQHLLSLYSTYTHFNRLRKTAFESILGKEEIARNEQFLLFPQCFLLEQIILSPFVHIFAIISLFAYELGESKIGISGKGLKST